MNLGGIVGASIFNVRDGNYNEQIEFVEIMGTNAFSIQTGILEEHSKKHQVFRNNKRTAWLHPRLGDLLHDLLG